MSRLHTSEKNSPLRRGLVGEVDPAKARVKVIFPDEGDQSSYWLNVNQAAAGGAKAYWMPDVGSQVNVLMDWNGEGGTVLGSLYSEADAPPTNNGDQIMLRAKDGAIFDYNQGTGTLSIKIGGTSVTATGEEVTITASKITLRGEVLVDGNAVVTGNLDVGGGLSFGGGGKGQGDFKLEGKFEVEGDAMKHNGKNVGHDHKHQGVKSGGSNTGTPLG